MIRILLAILVLISVTPLGRAQFPPDHWLIGDQYDNFLLWNPLATTPLGGSGPGRFASNAVDKSDLFSADESGNVFAYNVLPVTGLSLSWSRFSVGIAGPPMSCLDRKRIWMLSRYGLLAYMNRDGSSLGLVVVVADVFSLIGVPYAGDRQVSGVCTDGRDLFFSISATTATTHHIFAIDLTASPLQLRPIASMPLTGGAAVPRRGAGLSMGPDGTLMVLDQEVRRIDPLTGSVQTLSGGAYWSGLPASPGYWNEFAQPFAYNVWNGTAVAGPNYNGMVFRWDGTSWTQTAYWFYMLGLMSSTSPTPFILFGRGCLNSLNREPRLGWRDLPRQGQSLTLTVRDAEPNGFAIFWVGGSDATWPGFGALPFDAGVFGAPGCRIYASSDMSYIVPVDGSGNASVTIPVPVNSALSGYEVFGQSASTSGGNVLGLAASDAVAIRIR